MIYDKEILDLLFNSTEKDMLKKSFIMDLLGEFDGAAKVEADDLIIVPAGVYGKDKKHKKPFTTAVGRFIFHRVFVEQRFAHLFDGYYNDEINKKNFGKFNKVISQGVIEDKITVLDIYDFIKKNQKYMPYVSILSPHITEGLLLVGPKIDKKKKELIKKYQKEIDAGDEKTVDKLEKELMAYAKDLLKDDESMVAYNSGAKGDFENNFKNLYLMNGVLKDPTSDEYNFVFSSYSEGIKRSEFKDVANALVGGPFSRGKKTAIGGWWEKLFLRAFAHIILDEPGSDCGTKRTIRVTLDDNFIDLFMYSYISEGGRLIELTSDKVKEYKGKTVNIRFPTQCVGERYCNKCSGNLFYRLGIKNVGTTLPQIASAIKLKSMKSFHDSTVNFTTFDPDKAFR